YARILGSAVFSRVDGADQGAEAVEEDEKTEESSRKLLSKENQPAREQDQAGTDTSDDEDDIGTPPTDEGDLLDPDEALYPCGGFCNPVRELRWWGNRTMYLYTTFASGMICEECQAEYDAIQR
ncbi:hypothetical protein FALBO_17045, partial [Fusarium albosuccineum]